MKFVLENVPLFRVRNGYQCTGFVLLRQSAQIRHTVFGHHKTDMLTLQ